MAEPAPGLSRAGALGQLGECLFVWLSYLQEVLTDGDATVDSRKINSNSLSDHLDLTQRRREENVGHTQKMRWRQHVPDLVPDVRRQIARVEELCLLLAVTVNEPAKEVSWLLHQLARPARWPVATTVLEVVAELHLVLQLWTSWGRHGGGPSFTLGMGELAPTMWGGRLVYRHRGWKQARKQNKSMISHSRTKYWTARHKCDTGQQDTTLNRPNLTIPDVMENGHRIYDFGKLIELV